MATRCESYWRCDRYRQGSSHFESIRASAMAGVRAAAMMAARVCGCEGSSEGGGESVRV